MSRVNKAYPHLLGGVSEEPPEKRGPGEHWLQDNFVSDPVRGLTRRAGAQFLDYGSQNAGLVDPDNFAATTRTYDFQVGANYYSLVYDTGGSGLLPTVYSRTSGQLVPMNYGVGAGVAALIDDGITSVTALGRYVVMSGPGLVPAYDTEELFGVEDNLRHHIVWIRGGAYSRRFRVALVRGNQKLWIEYTTPSASYPEPLDTSGLNVNDPDYLKQVNDLTNQYNSQVNAWIASALAAAQPENIASVLAEEVQASGFLASGETVEAVGPNVYINAPSVEDVEVDDGGDGSLARGVGNTVAAAELLSLSHIPGKVVRVRPNNNTDGQCFYMQALAKDGSVGTVTEVSWRECAGTRFTPTTVFGVLAVKEDGSEGWLDTDLDTLRGEDLEFSALPGYVPSSAGDMDSNPPQRVLGEPATMLTTFQDRLVAGVGNSVNSSKTSDYFNFFRDSIVTLTDADPVNFVALGGEDDVIRYALTYDRNLVLWGTGQYLVDGRKPFSPRSASTVRMASIKDATLSPPVLGDRFMFYSRERGDGTGSVHHLQPGQIQEAPETYELSRRLRTYLPGIVAEIQVANDPDHLYIRCSGDNHLKVFAYQDAANGERVLSAWSRWTFDSFLGRLVGVSTLNGRVFLLFVKFIPEAGETPALHGLYLASVAPQPGQEPFLDLWTVEADETVGPGFDAAATYAYDLEGEYRGADVPGGGSVYKGFLCPSSVVLTSPFATDRDGAALLHGRTVVNTVKVWTSNSSGFQYAVHANGQEPAQGAWMVPEIPDTPVTASWTTILQESFDSLPQARVVAPTPLVGSEATEWDGGGAGSVNSGVYSESAGFSLSLPVAGLDLTDDMLRITFAGEVTFGGTHTFTLEPVGNVVITFPDDGSSAPTVTSTPTGVTVESMTGDRTSYVCVLSGVAGMQVWNVSLVQGGSGFPESISDYMIESGTLGDEEPAADAPPWAQTSGVSAATALILESNGVGAAESEFVNREYRAQNEVDDVGAITTLAPVVHASGTVPVGRETREYRLTLQSYLWAPLTIKAVEWLGQLLYRARRL